MTDQIQTTPDPANPVSTNAASSSIWKRLVFMIAFAFIWSISRFVVGAIIVIQFFVVLSTGEANSALRSLGNQLAIYTLQLIRFLTFNTDEKPFPFGRNWPEDRKDEAGL